MGGGDHRAHDQLNVIGAVPVCPESTGTSVRFQPKRVSAFAGLHNGPLSVADSVKDSPPGRFSDYLEHCEFCGHAG